MDFFNLKNANPKQVRLEQTSIIQDLNNASSKQLPCIAIVNTNIMGTDWKVYFTEVATGWQNDRGRESTLCSVFLRPTKEAQDPVIVARRRPCYGIIPTSNIALKQPHRTAEMTRIDTKIGQNCDSDSDRENCKYSSKIPTATWLPPQYEKWQVLKFRLGIRNPSKRASRRWLREEGGGCSQQ